MVPSLAEIVNSTSNQFLSAACLPLNQDSRIRWRNRLHLTQNLAEHRAVPYDFLEIHLASDFVLEIKLLLGKLVLKFGNFSISKRVINRDRHLSGDLG